MRKERLNPMEYSNVLTFPSPCNFRILRMRRPGINVRYINEIGTCIIGT
jgi:hypothetical protein